MALSSATQALYLPSPEFFGAMAFLRCVGIIVGVIGNLMVIFYNIFGSSPKLPTSYFVISLAFADLLVWCTSFPTWFIEFSSVRERVIGNDLFCKIALITLGTGGSLSIANLLVITIDRFIYISKPLIYPLVMTWNRTYASLIIVWLLAVVNVSMIFFTTGTDTRYFYCTCPLIVVLVFVTLNVYAPFVGILMFNYKIYKVARNQRRRIKSESSSGTTSLSSVNDTRRRSYQKQQLKQIKTFAIIVGVMLLCILPTVLIIVVEKFICKYCLPTSVYIVGVNIVGINSLVNPIISVRSREYRNAFRNFFYKIINKHE